MDQVYKDIAKEVGALFPGKRVTVEMNDLDHYVVEARGPMSLYSFVIEPPSGETKGRITAQHYQKRAAEEITGNITFESVKPLLEPLMRRALEMPDVA